MFVSVKLKRKDANGNWHEVNIVYNCTISEYVENYHCSGDNIITINYIDAPISL